MSSKGLTVIENRARTARRQIISAKDIPTLWRMSVHAEYMRQAAKTLGMHLHGVNALTRLKIDIEREADRRIKAMRATGELAEQGAHVRSSDMRLTDLLGK